MNDKTIMFMHGWGFDESVWDEFGNSYCSDYDVVKVKMPAYGTNDSSEKLNNIHNIADEINSKGSFVSVLVGWSLGAQVAIQYTLKHPEKIGRLFLLCSNPCFIKRPDWRYGVDKNLLYEMKADLLADKQKTLRRFYALISTGSEYQQQILKLLKAKGFHQRLTSKGLNAGLDLLINSDLRNSLMAVSVPTTLCFSEKDPLINPALFFDKPFYSNNIEYALIKNADHLPFLSKPKETADLIMGHL